MFAVAFASAAQEQLDFSGFGSFDLLSSSSVQKIEVGLDFCPYDDNDSGSSELTKIQWTVEPLPATDSNSTTILLSSKPPGIVEAVVDSSTGILRFRNGFYLNIYHVGGAGVRIQVPAQQLKTFATVGSSLLARVLPGFSNLTRVQVDSIAASIDVQVLVDEDDTPTNADSVQASPLVISGTGESNVIRIGKDAISSNTTNNNHIVQMDVGGRFNGIFVFGSTIGAGSSLSCSECTLYADEPIEELTVEGTNTGVTTKVGCDNVEITADVASSSSSCRELGADNAMDFEFEGMDEDASAVSTTIFMFACDTSAAVQQHGRSMFGFYSPGGVALAAFLWYTLF